METIKNYLENMFMHLPNTPEVIKAKDELWQMMEDKYTELIEDGRTENEAVGTVISEFGNLSELAEELGLKPYMNSAGANTYQDDNREQSNFQMNRRVLTMEETLEYMKERSTFAFRIALGILSIFMGIVFEIMIDALDTSRDISGIFILIFIAVAIGIFIATGISMGKWEFIAKTPCAIDYATSKVVENEYKQNRDTLSMIRMIGIIMCALCFMPAGILDILNPKFYRLTADDIGGIIFMAFIGIGVFMIVYSTIKLKCYNYLLNLNDNNTVSGTYTNEGVINQENKNSLGGKISSVYWPTVSCIYLSWSFLTFDWHITWVVWPIAAIVGKIIGIANRE